MKDLAKITSAVFHPLLMPFYGMLVMLYYSPISVFLLFRAKVFLLVLTFVTTCLIPLLFVFLLQNLKLISSLSMRARKERIVPLLFGALMCYVNYLLLSKIPRLPLVFPQLFEVLTLFLIALALIPRFWKISLHLAGIGGLLVILFAFSVQSWLFVAVIFCAGLVGTSRLLLKAHNSWQVYMGFLLGVSYFICWF